MNRILKLKGRFKRETPDYQSGPPKLPSKRAVSSRHLKKLADELIKIRKDWPNYGINANPVISVYYEKVVPKSSRIKQLLSENKGTSDKTIVGAKFWYENNRPKHQITHCLSQEALSRSIEHLVNCINVIDKVFGESISEEILEKMNSENERDQYTERLKKFNTTRSSFARILVDSCFIKRFAIDTDAPSYDDDVFVTLYKTDLSTPDLFEELGLTYTGLQAIDDTTILMRRDEYEVLKARAPYLIAMSLNEWTDLPNDVGGEHRFLGRSIQAPSDEPIIGVIDTQFDADKNSVYFADWVDYRNMVASNIPSDERSAFHGTCVTSIIVDGPSLNPLKDDGCGHFRVRHFGIAAGERFSIFTLVRNLRSIVSNNKDIKVWNLSLGSILPAPSNSISPVASILDGIQRENDVIFIVAGTNDTNPAEKSWKHLGSPADSINSLVVNSAKEDETPSSYSRCGPVLSFFTKPDVSYFGGDYDSPCLAWAPGAERYCTGTSYSAPWIARKMAYLIQIVGLTREAAKALIIDSAMGWKANDRPELMGYGIVPTRIEDILQTPDDEIRFIISGVAGRHETYNYEIPVPIYKNKQPYYAKATLCYFPSCTRSQGVDYTNTELEFKFGRIKNGRVKPINNDMQGENGFYTREDEARDNYRKWDNVKIVGEKIKDRRIPKITYLSPFWGISLSAKKRLDDDEREELPFGIVVTLKEMTGTNRIDSFIRNCQTSNWIVEEIDVTNSIEVYRQAEQEITFDDEL